MIYDIIIVGGGPAGLTAGIYALRAGKNIKIFEGETIGGHITSSPMVSNYPGFTNKSGMFIADSMYEQVEILGGEIELEEVKKIIPGDVFKVETDYDTYEAKSVILATGTTYRTLHLEKEEDFIGSGISFCVTCDGAFYKDKDVAVIGGGNSAMIEALELAKICHKVYMIVMDDHFMGEKVMADELLNLKNVEVHFSSTVKSLEGDADLTGIILNDDTKIKIDGMFEAIGQIPNVNIIEGIDKDNGGYVISNDDCTTNIKGLFVAGDVKSKKIRQLTTATSDGTIAVLNAINYIEKNKC